VDFPTYTVQDLADFFATEVDTFDDVKATLYITQASFLLELATCLKEPPTDPKMLQLWKNAVLDMAMKLIIGSDYLNAKWSPFSSETIGSYSYTIAANKIQQGDQTGVMWFDIAVMRLGVCDLMGDSGAHSGGGIEVFEHDGTFVAGTHPGNERLLSPNDIGYYPPFRLDGGR
jgi:hypothetical protein